MANPGKLCPKCGEAVEGRKKYCNSHCKFWFNSIKKDNEKYLPPAKKRNKRFCQVFTSVGNTASQKGQGKRSGGMICGSMSANVIFQVCSILPFTPENVMHHFTAKSNYNFIPTYILLGDGTKLSKEEALSMINISLVNS